MPSVPHRTGSSVRAADAPLLVRATRSAVPLDDPCTAAARWGYVNAPAFADLLGRSQAAGHLLSFWTAEQGEAQAICIGAHGTKLALAYIRDGRLLSQWIELQRQAYIRDGGPWRGYWNVPESFEEQMEIGAPRHLTPNLAAGNWRKEAAK